jgi:peptide chain release factor subunit 3
MHVHSAQEEVTFTALLHKLEKGTGRKSKKAPTHATKGMQIIARLEVISAVGQNSVCLEKYSDYPQMVSILEAILYELLLINTSGTVHVT